MSDRRVPGLLAIHLIVPEDWPREEIDVMRTPTSMNRDSFSGHWSGFWREKKSWQEEIEKLLMVGGIPRERYQRAIAGAVIRFPKRANKRDSGNFSGVVEKALGDALVNGRWIPDDTAERYCFVGVEFDEELGPPRTRIVLFTHKEEA